MIKIFCDGPCERELASNAHGGNAPGKATSATPAPCSPSVPSNDRPPDRRKKKK